MSWLRWIAAGLPHQRRGFDSSSIHTRFVTDRILTQYFCFLCQYHSTNAPHSSSSTRCSYQKNKLFKPANLPRGNDVSKTGENWIETSLSSFQCTFTRRTSGPCLRNLQSSKLFYSVITVRLMSLTAAPFPRISSVYLSLSPQRVYIL